MKLIKFLPFHFTFSIVFSILFGYYFRLSVNFSILLLLISFISLTASFFIVNQKLKFNFIYSFFSFCMFFSIGNASITFRRDYNKNNHYLNFSDENSKSSLIKISITKQLKPSNYYHKYVGKISQINNTKFQGSVLVNIKKDSLKNSINVSDNLSIYSNLIEINPPKNPYQFNYGNYLQKQNIYKQLTITKKDFIVDNTTHKNSLNAIAQKFRDKIYTTLNEKGLKKDELSIVNALLLGQRQEISEELSENYTKAGAVHILAISGLHIGIILLILNTLFKPLEVLKNGKNFKLVFVISFLWVFAFISGLSSSTIRACTMFTALAIGMLGNKKLDTNSNLIVSMFVLLLFNPLYLFDVGFQLSYLAVFFIVWLQPLLYNWWKPKFKIVDYCWKIFTVSLSAQIGVLPISLYYFHQFPGLFFITNIVVIPFLGFILTYGFIVIILATLNLLPEFIVSIYQKIISSLNYFITWVANQEAFIFQNIYFSLLLLIASYTLIVLVFKFIEIKKYKNLVYALVSVIALQLVFVYENIEFSRKEELVIFHNNKISTVGYFTNKKLTIHSNNDSLNASNYSIYPYIVNNKIDKLTFKKLSQTSFLHKNLFVVDSFGIYKLKNYNPKYVLLTQSPKVNLDRLIKYLNPQIIIADNTNFSNYIELWQKTCANNNVQFHSTYRQGAFVIE